MLQTIIINFFQLGSKCYPSSTFISCTCERPVIRGLFKSCNNGFANFYKSFIFKGLPIVAPLSESSTWAAPEVRALLFSPRIKVGEAKILALLLVIFASNQFKNCLLTPLHYVWNYLTWNTIWLLVRCSSLHYL